MKRIAALILAVLCIAGCVAGWATYQEIAQSHAASLARLMPQDAVLFLEARDLRAALADWSSSPQKQLWLNTDNHEVFSRSRLFLRLKQARDEFAIAAGLTPDMCFSLGVEWERFRQRLLAGDRFSELVLSDNADRLVRMAERHGRFVEHHPHCDGWTTLVVGDYLV